MLTKQFGFTVDQPGYKAKHGAGLCHVVFSIETLLHQPIPTHCMGTHIPALTKTKKTTLPIKCCHFLCKEAKRVFLPWKYFTSPLLQLALGLIANYTHSLTVPGLVCCGEHPCTRFACRCWCDVWIPWSADPSNAHHPPHLIPNKGINEESKRDNGIKNIK